MKWVFSFLLLLSNFGHAYAQIRSQQTPVAPMSNAAVYGTSASSYTGPQYHPINEVQLGGTSQDIVRRQQSSLVEASLQQKQQELASLLEEVKADQRRSSPDSRNKTVTSTRHIQVFNDALQHLQDMLSGRKRLSVADAYYTSESAYGTPYLSRQEYDAIIQQSVDFIKTWMTQNHLDQRNNDAVQLAIRKFMSEALTITKSIKGKDNKTRFTQVTHQPFHYDYNDYQGAKDYRNLFLTKCFATGFGQCASMPAVYLVLAERLGVKAYLSFAPQHSFVKFKDNKGLIHNYEPTSNWEISDKWYEDNMFISPQAVASGIYLDTLDSHQVVANCVFDLATYYILIDRTGNDDVLTNCLKTGIPFFRNNNLPSLFIYSMMLKTQLRDAMRKNRMSDLDDVKKIPEVEKIYNEYMGNEAYITKLGYQDMPSGMYDEMLEQHEFKGKIQKQVNISGKEKRNLFNSVQ